MEATGKVRISEGGLGKSTSWPYTEKKIGVIIPRWENKYNARH